MAFTGYNETWRLSRRIFHQTFRPDSALKFRPMHIRRAHEMILNLLDEPQQYNSHFATFSSSVAMSAVYDYESSARDDPLVRVVADALDIGLAMMTPEKAMSTDWCPGSSIKRDAQVSTNRTNEMMDVPFRYAKQRVVDNFIESRSSMVAENLRRMEKEDEAFKPMFETALKRAATTAFAGAYETTTSTLMVFVLAMVLHPDVQKRAQAEIDLVIGRDRLPTFDDRTSLPYIDAIFRETLRWESIVPLGVPHATTSDDVFDGYLIPKGTTAACNLWGIARDERRYPDASRFIPERFIQDDGTLTDDDPARYIFGFGRRICPGRHTADASVWSAIATMLASLDISPAKDEQGKVIDFTPEFTAGLTRHPKVFPCSFSPRSHVHSELLDELRTAI
ncbi:cytochrome P450 [Rhizopogon vinicolor AM-OR11-026]|uniref:Cytochrome P450 n=1 Tax=Rhizopogon vinicolor AM-OR11-026 TaxID=1314800 RepID=A0A1B7MZQ0_9AGAM|nr:cytochrome P450 [Rhizopogon vinicolor AM-OR11-026]